jgi:hypothetical protein
MSEDQVLTGLSRLKRELAQLKSHLQEIEEYVERLEAEPPVQETATSIPAPSPLSLSGVAEFASQAEQASNQEGILVALLESAGGLCENALLLVENEAGGYSPWNSRGFDSEDWQNLFIGRDDPVAQKAQEQHILTFDRDGENLPDSLKSLGGTGKAASLPLTFGDRVPVILLAASTAELDLDSLRLIVELARLYIQNQFLSTLEGDNLTTASASSRWPTLEPLAAAPARTEDQPPASEPKGLEIESELAEGSAVSMEVETVPAEEVPTLEPVEAEASGSEAGLAPESVVETSEPPPVPEAEGQTLGPEAPPEDTYQLDDFPEVKPEELGMSDEEFSRLMGKGSSDWKSSGETAEAKPAQYQESSGPEPGPEPVEGGDEKQDVAETSELHDHTPVQEEEVMHSEARRFARLLVAEIKLYNEDEVQEGRVSSDLYRRLKADIDRSREMYEKRVAPTVRESEDYFHSEIIRVLAQDDPALMGSDYPGPQVGPTS